MQVSQSFILGKTILPGSARESLLASILETGLSGTHWKIMLY